MSDGCVRCGHDEATHHDPGDWKPGCRSAGCRCPLFTTEILYPNKSMPDPTERIAVALESIAKSLDAMRREGR